MSDFALISLSYLADLNSNSNLNLNENLDLPPLISPQTCSLRTLSDHQFLNERIQFQQTGRIEKNLTTTKLVKANVLHLPDNNTKIIY